MPVRPRSASPASRSGGRMVKPRGFQPRNCGFESRPDPHGPIAQQAEHATDNREVDRSNRSRSTTFLGVAQRSRAPALEAGGRRCESCLPDQFRGHSSTGRATGFHPVGCRIETGCPLQLRRLARLACLSVLKTVMPGRAWGFDPSSLRHNTGEPSLIGKAPGRDPGRCRFKSGGSPQIRRSGRAV